MKSQLSSGSLDGLESTFMKCIQEIERVYVVLPKALRIRVEKWVEKLVLTGPNLMFRKHRNNYARLLLNMVMTRHLSDPFNSMPADGPLPSFPIHAKAITKDMLGVHESSFWRELYGKLQDEPTENRSSILNVLNNSHHDHSFQSSSTSAIKSSTFSREVTTLNLLVKEQNSRIQLLEQQLQEERVQYELKIQRLQYMHRQQINQYVTVLANNSLPVPSLNMSTTSLHGLTSPNQSMMQDTSLLSHHALPPRSSNTAMTNLSMNMLTSDSTLPPTSIFSKGNMMRGSNRYQDSSEDTPLRAIPAPNYSSTHFSNPPTLSLKPSTFPIPTPHRDMSMQSMGYEQSSMSQNMSYPPPPPPSVATTFTPSMMSTTQYTISPMTHQTTPYDTSIEDRSSIQQGIPSLSMPKVSLSPYSSSEHPLPTSSTNTTTMHTQQPAYTPAATTTASTSTASWKPQTHPSVTFAPQLTTTTLISPTASSTSHLSPLYHTSNIDQQHHTFDKNNEEADMIQSRQTLRLSDTVGDSMHWSEAPPRTIQQQYEQERGGHVVDSEADGAYDIVPGYYRPPPPPPPQSMQPSPRSSMDSSSGYNSMHRTTQGTTQGTSLGTTQTTTQSGMTGYAYPHPTLPTTSIYTPSQPMISSMNSLPPNTQPSFSQPVLVNPSTHPSINPSTNPNNHYHEILLTNSFNESSILPISQSNRLKVESGYSSSDTSGGGHSSRHSSGHSSGHSDGSMRSTSSLSQQSRGSTQEAMKHAAALEEAAGEGEQGSVHSHHSQSSRVSQGSQQSLPSTRSNQSSHHTQQSQQSHHTQQSQQSHPSIHSQQTTHSVQSNRTGNSSNNPRDMNQIQLLQGTTDTSYGVPVNPNSFGGIAMVNPHTAGQAAAVEDAIFPTTVQSSSYGATTSLFPSSSSSSHVPTEEGLSSSDEEFLDYIDQFQAKLHAATGTIPHY